MNAMKGNAVEALKGAAEHSILNVTFVFFLWITKEPMAMFRWLGDVLISSVGAVLFFSVVVLSIAYQARCLSWAIANDSAHSPRRRRNFMVRLAKSSVDPVVTISYLVFCGYAALTLMRMTPEDVALRVPGHFLPEYFLLCFVALLSFGWIFQVIVGPRRVRVFDHGGARESRPSLTVR